MFTRVITDHGGHFDEVRDGYEGELFLEVVPMSFTVKVRTGHRAEPAPAAVGHRGLTDDELRELAARIRSSFPGDVAPGRRRGRVRRAVPQRGPVGRRRVRRVPGQAEQRAARARPRQRLPVGDFWERVEPEDGPLILARSFYLLLSHEGVRIPPDYAAEMAAYDPTSGELRTHYAGFFDPGFGDVPDGAGTPAVLEVRAHDVPFALEHGQRLCKLTFERMAAAGRALRLGDRVAISAAVPDPQPIPPDQAGGPKPGRMKENEQPLPLGRAARRPLPVTPRA